MSAQSKVTCHGAGLVSADADFKNSFTIFVQQGKIGGISVAFEGKHLGAFLRCEDNGIRKARSSNFLNLRQSVAAGKLGARLFKSPN